MCGLLCAISSRPLSRDLFTRALKTLAKRGPDEHSTWFDQGDRIGLGHRRLSLVSQTKGSQPLHNEKQNIHAIVNGEFYDYEILRTKLEKKGHRFRTDSDSEILIHLYEEYGENCVDHLIGEFAFILWDSTNEKIVAARDRFGVKPLVFGRTAEGWVFASKAKAIFPFTGGAKWDRQSLFQSLHHQYHQPDRTLFEGIFSLRPGHLLCLEKGVLLTKPYWDIPSENRKGDSTLSLRTLLTRSVQRRLQGDFPIATCLSGGIDSSAITAILSTLQKDTQAFCVAFQGYEKFDERHEAMRVADHLQIDLNLVEVDEESVLAHLKDATFHSEGLAINAHLSGKYLLNRAIHEAGFKALLSGEGADEIFFAYPHLRQDVFPGEELANSNDLSRGLMVALNSETFPSINSSIGYTPSFFKPKFAAGKRLMTLLSEEFQTYLGEVPNRSILSGFEPTHLKNRKPAYLSTYLWSRLALSNYILSTLGDGTEMAHSVEGRTPFLDKDVVDFAFQHSPESFFKQGLEKHTLREAVKDLLPQATLLRHKQPFIGPPICFAPKNQTRIRGLFKELENLPIWNARSMEIKWKELITLPIKTQQLWEPVFMTAFTSLALQQNFNLEIS